MQESRCPLSTELGVRSLFPCQIPMGCVTLVCYLPQFRKKFSPAPWGDLSHCFGDNGDSPAAV